jgi:hypothetical protein
VTPRPAALQRQWCSRSSQRLLVRSESPVPMRPDPALPLLCTATLKLGTSMCTTPTRLRFGSGTANAMVGCGVIPHLTSDCIQRLAAPRRAATRAYDVTVICPELDGDCCLSSPLYVSAPTIADVSCNGGTVRVDVRHELGPLLRSKLCLFKRRSSAGHFTRVCQAHAARPGCPDMSLHQPHVRASLHAEATVYTCMLKLGPARPQLYHEKRLRTSKR